MASEFFLTAGGRSADAALFYKGRPALGEDPDESLSFGELAKIASAFACEFHKKGVRRGDRTLVMLRYSPEFICTVFALFSIGAVPVLIDPGMGLSRLLHCISKTAPRGLVGIPAVHWLRLFMRSPFSSVKMSFSTAGFIPPFLGATVLPTLREIFSMADESDMEAVEMGESDLAAIVFTTGSTGPAKGVEYTHGIFKAQLGMIRKYYGAGPEHVDMPCFPLFAMFSLCLGMPCAIPDIDPSRPAKAPPEKIIETVRKHNVSFSFGSPALWRRVSDHCISKGIRLDTLRKVLMAGAPVPASLHEKLKTIISPDGDTMVPYGATESLPVANFAGSEMLSDTAALSASGAGYCVGHVVSECEVRIIRPSDGPLPDIGGTESLPDGEIGEIIARGPVVTRRYHGNSAADALAKIADGEAVWHRMGDMGYFDGKKRLWFCGRKSHAVMTKAGPIYPAAAEAPFNIATGRRCAIVGLGKPGDETPVLVVEGAMSDHEFGELRETLEKCAAKLHTPMRISQFERMKKFPVDIRHNAKIRREEIREEVGEELRAKS